MLYCGMYNIQRTNILAIRSIARERSNEPGEAGMSRALLFVAAAVTSRVRPSTISGDRLASSRLIYDEFINTG